MALALCATAHAQSDYPNQAIHLVVPFPPGSTSDIAARAVAQKIAGPLGQPVLVENRPGANGALGMQAVARARPDGYTLVVGSVSSTAVPAAIMKTPPFDLLREFQPVAVIAGTTLVLMAAKEAPYDSVADLLAAARKAPGSMTYGNSAGLFLLAMESLKIQSRTDFRAIAYKGPGDAANDLVGGRLSVQPDSLGSATRLIQAGRTKPLAVLSGKRTSAFPQVPTMQELGYKDFDFNSWIGILAPAGTPEPIVERLHREIARAVAADDVRQSYVAAGMDPVSMTPTEYRALLARETAKYQRIVQEAGIEKQ
ncbi:tripartite tricarboxylate transporter substrate binding protein [Schlegelella sp. ID0723]|uniref:Tripartite tricarboxylate transporter substrate binding protein n=1 Tax=Piscinibacter koreensis TaxID=2742824 RepID=A0A7Y6NKE2_9BURK|nr:tripartite tricarboxylate transporter substrate binding protein [Schlegelella koreensis]